MSASSFIFFRRKGGTYFTLETAAVVQLLLVEKKLGGSGRTDPRPLETTGAEGGGNGDDKGNGIEADVVA